VTSSTSYTGTLGYALSAGDGTRPSTPGTRTPPATSPPSPRPPSSWTRPRPPIAPKSPPPHPPHPTITGPASPLHTNPSASPTATAPYAFPCASPSTTATPPPASPAAFPIVAPSTNHHRHPRHCLRRRRGTKTLYTWYKDAAGNVSTTASASILLDQTAPTN